MISNLTYSSSLSLIVISSSLLSEKSDTVVLGFRLGLGLGTVLGTQSGTVLGTQSGTILGIGPGTGLGLDLGTGLGLDLGTVLGLRLGFTDSGLTAGEHFDVVSPLENPIHHLH